MGRAHSLARTCLIDGVVEIFFEISPEQRFVSSQSSVLPSEAEESLYFASRVLHRCLRWGTRVPTSRT